MADEPERLPPPPSWRTRYFAFDVLSRRDHLDPIEIRRIIRRPERREVQNDGRGTSQVSAAICASCYSRTEKPYTTRSSTRITNEALLRQIHRQPLHRAETVAGQTDSGNRAGWRAGRLRHPARFEQT